MREPSSYFALNNKTCPSTVLHTVSYASFVLGRVTGRLGYGNGYSDGMYFTSVTCYLLGLMHLCMLLFSGRSYAGINEEIMYVSIGMGIIIAILICIALCYIARENCKNKREYYITA